MPDIFTPSVSLPKEKTFDVTHSHPFAAYCTHPKGIHFKSQENGEKVLLLLRRHLITNVPWLVTTLLLILLPLVLNIFAFPLQDNLPFNLPSQFLTILIIFYYLAVFAYGFVSLITWFYNVSLVTTQRIVDVDFSDIIYHNVAATKLTLVQDVDYTQAGVIRAVFNFGDVFVQTASSSPNFDFLAVPKPGQVVNLLESLIGKKPYVP